MTEPETWNGSWATPLTMGRHQRADDSYFVVWTDDDETWLWQNETGCANGDIEPSGLIMGPYATAADAARAAWPNLEPLALTPKAIDPEGESPVAKPDAQGSESPIFPAASAPTGQAQGNVAEAGVSQGTSL